MYEMRFKSDRDNLLLLNLPVTNVLRRLAAAKADYPGLKNIQRMFGTRADFITVWKSIGVRAFGKRKCSGIVGSIRIFLCRQG